MTEHDRGWLKTARIFALESWWPPFWPHIEVDWDRALWTMKRLHLDTLQANALTKWACYPTDLVRRHPELGDRDLVQEALEFCARNGFRCIIYTLFGHAMPISTQLSKPEPALFRPMWKSTSPRPPVHRDTVPQEFQDYHTRFHFGDELYVAHCTFAAREWLLQMATELAERYEYDAAWIDGSIDTGAEWAGNPICCCPVCQQAYLQDFGRPMPLVEGPDAPRILELRRWNMRRLDPVLGEVAEELTKGRTVPLIGNLAHGTGPACFNPPILRHLNGGLFEHAPDRVGLVLKLAESKHLVETAIHYPDCYDPWPRRVTSGWDVETKGLIILSGGGTPYLAQPGKYYYDDSADAPARRVFKLMEEHRDLFGTQRRYAACAVSLQPMSVGAADSGYHRGASAGWVSAMLDAHVPVDAAPYHVLQDAEGLSRVPVWVLPDVRMIGRDVLQALREHVAQGGGLYLSGDPGKLDGNHRPRENGEVAELFDLHPWTPTRDGLLRRHRFDGGRRTYDLYMQLTDEAPDGFRLPGPSIQPCDVGYSVPGESWQVLASLVPTDEDNPLLPALAVRRIGKGRIAFSTVSWGQQYVQRRAPELAGWMADLVGWLGAGQPPVRLEGSRLVQLGLSRLDDGWMVYLINNSSDVQGKRTEWAEMMKVAEPPLRVGPVRLHARGAGAVKGLYGPEPDNVRDTDEGLCVEFEDFRQHVVLRLEASGS